MREAAASGPSRITLADVRWLVFPRVLGIALALYLAGMTGLFGYFASENTEFTNSASSVEGVVIALQPRPLPGSSHQPSTSQRNVPYAPVVSYQVGGHTYTYTPSHGRYGLTEKVGDHATVLYDPANPSVARLRGEGRILMPVLPIAFGLATAAVVVALVATRSYSFAGRAGSGRGPFDRSARPHPTDHAGSGPASGPDPGESDAAVPPRGPAASVLRRSAGSATVSSPSPGAHSTRTAG